MGGRLHLLLRAPQPGFSSAGGPSGPFVDREAAGGGVGGSSLPRGDGASSFQHSRGPAQTLGEADLKHTRDCPRCMVQYETCIQSLMAQVQDLRTQNLELQWSHQELSQTVAPAAGISQSYRDRMSQNWSTLTNYNTLVQGYQQDSRAVAPSVVDHPTMSNRHMAKCFSSVKTLAMHCATVASRIHVWDQWYATPTQPVLVVPPLPSTPRPVPEPEPAAPTAPMGARSGSSGGGCVLPFCNHPFHDCIYH